jgi:ACT domain-containing protein
MLLLRVQLPDRPGALGAVASVLGALGADISLVEIVERRGGVGVNDFILDLPPDQTVPSLVAACDSLPGVEVHWVRNYPRGGGIELDVELDRQMLADSSRAAETLASAAPLIFRAEWSLLLQVSDVLHVTFSSPGAPELDPGTAQRFGPFDTIHRVALESGWLPGWAAHNAVVAPISEHRALVVGRRGEPPFFPSELTRLAHLVGSADTSQILDQALPTTVSEAHRTPIAAPLYRYDDRRQH